jgi:Flp pilus assembly protein TadD
MVSFDPLFLLSDRQACCYHLVGWSLQVGTRQSNLARPRVQWVARRHIECRMHIRRGCFLAVIGGLAISVAGCETDQHLIASGSEPALSAPTSTVQSPDEIKYFPSDEPLHMGLEQFDRGNYGVAEHYFQDAVEKGPKDATAWVGLAATYDRLGRFDLADRAYNQAILLSGETTQILNNEGYSYMLRGDLVRARRKFEQAYKREPNNPRIANNLKLLNSSSRYVQHTSSER